MAAIESKRSIPLAQPQRRRSDSQFNPQLKAQLLEALRHLNRGFGVALTAFDRLQRQDRLQKPGAFPYECLHNYRNRTEELRALANRDLLRLFAGREELEAERFGRLCGQPAKHPANHTRKRRS